MLQIDSDIHLIPIFEAVFEKSPLRVMPGEATFVGSAASGIFPSRRFRVSHSLLDRAFSFCSFSPTGCGRKGRLIGNRF